jgi:hypothetical protein
MAKQTFSRRQFLHWSALSGSAIALAACAVPQPAAAPAPDDVPEATLEPEPAVESADNGVENDVEVIVGDVVDFALKSDEWPGAFGFVTLALHEASYNGEPAYFIRTDGGDPAFAEEHGLVYVPLLNTAAGRDFLNRMYVFEDDRPPVIAMTPADEAFISLFEIVNVTVSDDSAELSSAAAIEAAGDAVALEPTGILVNYPLVKWPGDELPVDTEKDSYLGTGPLIDAPDLDAMTVTFKLHECFPGSYYIITDTSAVPMAPMMGIAPAGPSQQLAELGGTDAIWVFGNGIEGSGVMGFQPAIFGNPAGTPAWSPFWNHFTVTWNEGVEPRVLRASDELRAALDADELELFNGTPDTHPEGFVVNCPVPIKAPNRFHA